MTVIILSNTKNPQYYYMLKECIDSIHLSKCIKKIIVVETNCKLKNKHIDLNAEFLFPCINFNYNKFLNIAFEHIDNTEDKLTISNNDVIYEPGCFDELDKALSTYDSVSPTTRQIIAEDKFTEGYDIEKIVMGWCIAMNRSVQKKIGLFDEKFSFWYQDNDYANTLKKLNFKHARVNSAYALHKYQQSHKLLENSYAYTHGLSELFNEKWG